jgi:hypothetical protein
MTSGNLNFHIEPPVKGGKELLENLERPPINGYTSLFSKKERFSRKFFSFSASNLE